MSGRLPISLLIVLATIACLGTLLAVQYLGWTADMASYLQTRNWVLGVDYTGIMPFHSRPPLIGVVLVPFTALSGDILGSKILAILSILAFCISIYTLAKYYYGKNASAMIAFLGVLNPLSFELLTGGYVSFLAATFGILLLRNLVAKPKHYILTSCLYSFLMVGINQTTPFVFGLVFICMPQLRTRAGLQILVATIVGALPWTPFLFQNVGLSGLWYGPENWLDVGWPRGYSAFPYLSILIMAGLLPIVCKSKHKNTWLLPCIVLLICATIWHPNIAINNVFARTQILVPTIFALASLDLLLVVYKNLGKIAVFCIMPLLVLSSYLTANIIANKLYILTPDNLAAIEWISKNTNTSDVIGAHRHGLGWWVGGMTGRAWTATWPMPLESPAYYNEEYDNLKCVLGWMSPSRTRESPTCSPDTTLLADYIVVDWEIVRNWKESLREEYSRETIESNRLVLVWQQGEVQIYAVLGPRAHIKHSGRTWPTIFEQHK